MVDDIRHLVYEKVFEYIKRGSYDTAQQAIVEFNLNVNHVPSGCTQVPFLHTVTLASLLVDVGQLHCFLDFLVERGANLELTCTRGWTPFTYAVCYSKHATLDTLRYLIHKGANARHCDADGSNALHDIVSGHFDDLPDETVRDRIQFLVEEVGLDPNVPNNMGVIPLQYCVSASKFVHVETLLKLGSNPNYRSKSGNTAFTNAANYRNAGTGMHPNVFHLLLKYGADPFQKRVMNQLTAVNALEILIHSFRAKNQWPSVKTVKALVRMGLCVTDSLVKDYMEKPRGEHDGGVGSYLRAFPRHHFKALLCHLREELVQLTLESDAGKRIAAAKCNLQVVDVDCMRMFQVPYHCLFESMNLFMEWTRKHHAVFTLDDVRIDALRAEITSVISALARAYEQTCMGRAQLQALADETTGEARKRTRKE